MNKAPNRHSLLGTLALSLATLVTAGAIELTAPSELQRLQGTWTGAIVGDHPARKITITISGDSLHFHRDTNFWFKTTFTLPAGKDPHELHATIKDCAPPQDSVGKTVVAIFKIEDETLTLGAINGDAGEMPKNFETPGLALYELRKVQPEKKNFNLPKTK